MTPPPPPSSSSSSRCFRREVSFSLSLSLSRHLSPPSRSLPLPMDAQRTSLLLLGTPRLELISSFSEKERGEAMEKKKKGEFF